MKRIMIVSGILLIVLIVGVASLPFLIDANSFRPRLEAELSKALGRDVKLGNLKLTILSGTVSASDLSIAEDPAFAQASSANPAFISAKTLETSVALMPLILERKLQVTGIEIVGPEIRLVETSAGKWNFSSLGGQNQSTSAPAQSTPGSLSIQKLKITDGRISLQQGWDDKTPAPPIVLAKVDIEVSNFSAATAFPVKLSASLPDAGDISLDGTVGPINSADSAATPLEMKFKLAKLNLVKSGFVPAAAGLAGLVSFDGVVTSDGQKMGFRIMDGSASLDQWPAWKDAPRPVKVDQVNIEIKNFATDVSFPLTMSARIQDAVQFSLEGTAGPANKADPQSTPFNAKFKLAKLDLVKSGFVRPSTGFSGVVSFDGSATSDGRKVGVKAALQGDKVILAKGGSPAKGPLSFTFALDHDIKAQTGSLTRGDIGIGGAKADLRGTYQLPDSGAVIHMKLTAPSMAISELEKFLPALNVVLPNGTRLDGGTVAANLTFEGPADRLVTSGNLSLNNTRLTGFDLGSKMKTVATIAGVKIAPNTDLKVVGAALRMDPDVTRVDNISVIAQDIGELKGAGTISAAHALDFKMRANLHAAGGVVSVVTAGRDLGVPFSVQGTSSDPKFVPDVKGMAVERLKAFQPADIGKTVDEFKKAKPDDAVKAAGDLIDLFRKKK